MKTNMNAVPTIFNFEGHKVRTLEYQGKPYFVAKDVAEVLGYSNTRDAISRHCRKTTTVVKPDGGFMTLIPESDLYLLIFKSRLPSAERFTDWVTEVVLPSIRQHGGYITKDTLNDPKKLRELLLAQTELYAAAKPKAELVDKCCLDQVHMPLYLAARKFDMTVPRLSNLLLESGFFKSIPWGSQKRRVPRKEFEGLYFVTETSRDCQTKTYITEEGLKLIQELMEI